MKKVVQEVSLWMAMYMLGRNEGGAWIPHEHYVNHLQTMFII